MNEELLKIFGPELPNHSAIAIGAFDGLHRGHRHILNNMITYARENGLTSVAILFDPLPREFFSGLGCNDRILLRTEQEPMLYEMGIDKVIYLPFSQSIADITPEDFISSMQHVFHCERLFMGADHVLGKGGSGTTEVLTKLGEKYGFSTEIIEKDLMDGDVISSTRIRELLHAGNITEADRLLEYPFFFSGEIIHGDARGRNLGFPTLNIKIPEGKLHLPNGVYATYANLDGERFTAVTNVGVRPTFGLEEHGVFVETFLLNTNGNFYGDELKLEFIEMLRKETKFDSTEALKAQIDQDISKTIEILACQS